MKKIILALIFILGIAAGVAVSYTAKENLGNIVSYAYTPSGELCVLYYELDNAVMIKTDSNGTEIFKKILPFSVDGYDDIPRDLVVDDKGNIYIRFERKNPNTIVDERLQRTIVSERIEMYSYDGNPQGVLLYMDYSKEPTLKIENSIIKMQPYKDLLKVICKKAEEYSLVQIDLVKRSAPEIISTFKLDRELFVKNDAVYVNDVVITSDNRIVYSTNAGGFFISDNEELNGYKDLSAIMEHGGIIGDISIDQNDNVYFLDIMEFDYYKYSVKNDAAELLYNKNSKISKTKDILLQDVKYIRYIGNGHFSGASIDVNNWFFNSFGVSENYISSINKNLEYRLIIFAIVFASVVAVLLIIYSAIALFQVRFKLTAKILLAFVPVYFVFMAVLGYMLISTNMKSYTDQLYKLLEGGAKIAADEIDVELLSGYDFINGYMDETFAKLKSSLEKTILDIDNKVGSQDGYLIIYTVRNGRIYTALTTDLSFDRDRQVGLRPLEYTISSKYTGGYYDFLKKAQNTDVLEMRHLMERDFTGNWIGVIMPLKNSSGEVIGFLENGVNMAYTYDVAYSQGVRMLLSTLLIFSIPIFVYFVIVIRINLKPLKSLGQTIQEISRGKLSATVKISSRDEISDIGNTFNIMTGRLRESISTFTELNRAYVKFIPDELIKLLDKENILEIQLSDYTQKEMSILFVSFNMLQNQELEALDSVDYFKMMNSKFDLLFEIVAANGGIIERFDGMGMLVLFPGKPEDALLASIQFSESLADDSMSKNLRMIIATGKILLGVAGNVRRNSIATISGEITSIYAMNNYLDKISTNYIITEDAMKHVDDAGLNFSYRYIGKLPHPGKMSNIGVYEVLNGILQSKKQLYFATKDTFEKGINYYVNRDIPKARKCFVDVLRINAQDSIAMHYLFLCDRNKTIESNEFNDTLIL